MGQWSCVWPWTGCFACWFGLAFDCCLVVDVVPAGLVFCRMCFTLDYGTRDFLPFLILCSIQCTEFSVNCSHKLKSCLGLKVFNVWIFWSGSQTFIQKWHYMLFNHLPISIRRVQVALNDFSHYRPSNYALNWNLYKIQNPKMWFLISFCIIAACWNTQPEAGISFCWLYWDVVLVETLTHNNWHIQRSSH